jgi:hypothetical protein
VNKFKPAMITRDSFAFCRATIAILIWLSLILQVKWLLLVVFAVMLISAVTKVEKAPLILAYRHTVDRIAPSPSIMVDERGIYVSHVTGAVFALLCIGLLYLSGSLAGWVVTVLFAILQTSAAFGFCSALKLYNCINGGTCCRVGKVVKKGQNHA